MFLKVRYKENSEKEFSGVAVSQWSADGKLRLYILLPRKDSKGKYCEVHVALEEVEEWKALSDDESYSTQPLPDDTMPVIDENTQEDLYYVWDDGAENHFERASRLYKMFESTIEEFEALIKR